MKLSVCLPLFIAATFGRVSSTAFPIPLYIYRRDLLVGNPEKKYKHDK